ncbi:MAG TPA: hypothetical protein VMG12_15880 [Polyangiaceae bacterium]|nr:hypothetical protein [Polyangiaceae bacterium]
MKVPPSRGLVVIAVLLGLGGLVLYWALSGDSSPAPERLARHTSEGVSRRAPPEPGLQPTQPSANAPNRDLEGLARGSEPREPEVTSAVAPPQRDHDVDETGHPHPITAKHRRIFEENNRIGAMDGAMDQGDFAALRRMNADYRRDYPEDDHDLQQGYDLIADCLEARTPHAVTAARAFWQEHRASALRRYVRRHCLEERP